MKIGKTSEVNFFVQNENPVQADLAVTNAAMFGCEFNPDDGLQVEKNQVQENQNKTYTCTKKDEYGDTVIETYRVKDDVLISRKSKYCFDQEKIEYFLPGTTIVSKTEMLNSAGELVEEEYFYPNTPFGKEKTISYETETGDIKTQYFYRNGDSENPVRSIHKDLDSITELIYEGSIPIERVVTGSDGRIKEQVKRQLIDGDFRYSVQEFRTDGTKYSEGVYQDFYSLNKVSCQNYRYDGKTIESKEYRDWDGNICREKYFENGELSRKEIYSSDSRKMLERTVYDEGGNVFVHIKYNENGAIISCEKNENSPYNGTFNENMLDGKIDTNIRQGKSGICYLASTVKGLTYTTKGQELLAKTLVVDDETGDRIIRLGNPKKDYRVTKKEIEEAYGRLSTGDPDFTAFCLGYEAYRSDKFGKIIDGGTADEVLYAITGKEVQTNLYKGRLVVGISEGDLDKLQEMMKNSDTVVVVGTPDETVNTEVAESDEKNGVFNNHALTLKAISDDKVVLYDSLKGIESEYSREEFLQKFVYYGALEL